MRWSGQELTAQDDAALPGLARLNNLVRTVRTPEFGGIAFHEVVAKSALNRVPGQSAMPFGWTINPYRGCSHGCVYCFARRTHEYLDLDAGRDFDAEIIVKVNVAEVLRAELAKPSWGRHPVALGTNTDPYQRAEGRYALMPGIIEALVDARTPFSILTKGTLLRRDLPLIAEAAKTVPVDLAMSIAVYDDALQASIEPGTPSAKARLQTVRAIRDAGMDCTVFLMPVLPHLTDSRAQLDEALGRIKEAGATRVITGALHLRPGAREWFLAWIDREHPELAGKYAGLYPQASSSAPSGYRRWLSDRVRPLMRAHGLVQGEEDPSTGSVRSTALRSEALGFGGRRVVVDDGAPSRAAQLEHPAQPTLF
jgi:DNA repair photolyase